MRQRDLVLKMLNEWAGKHADAGGEFSDEALFAAGEAALRALRGGYSLDEAFALGRQVFFQTFDRPYARPAAALEWPYAHS